MLELKLIHLIKGAPAVMYEKQITLNEFWKEMIQRTGYEDMLVSLKF